MANVRKSKKSKKVVAIGDLHCGNRVGLTPPAWNYQISNAKDKYPEIREECWELFTEMIDRQKPIDLLIANGDLIDGTGYRPLGTDVMVQDRDKQCEMAIECLGYADARNIVMTLGTPYHVGEREDWEKRIYRGVKADHISSEETFNVNGLIFNCKHFCGRSSIPHGRSTPLLRDRLNNILWEEKGLFPKADILIRSHVHYFHFAGGDTHLVVSLPSLAGLGSKYGARLPSEPVDFGIVFFDIEENGEYSWGFDIALGEKQKTRIKKY